MGIPRDFVCVPKYYKMGLTSDPKMMLREQAVSKLLRAKKSLPNGWNFLIWDGYRPLELQAKLYKGLTDLRKKEHPEWDEEKLEEDVEKFVKSPSYDPRKPSPHNTGGAADLTIIDDKGTELQMGTEFDEFNKRSYSNFFELEIAKFGEDKDKSENGPVDPKILEFRKNREILKEVLMAEELAPYEWEWWHFNFGNTGWAEFYGKDNAIYGSLEL